MNSIIQWALKSRLDSWIRFVATALGGWLTANSIPTGSVLEAVSGTFLVAFGFLSMWIDANDPTGQGKRLWQILIGGKEQAVAAALARKILILVFTSLNGLGMTFDTNQALNGSVVSFAIMVLGLAAERLLKFLPGLPQRR